MNTGKPPSDEAVYYSATMFSLAGFDNPTATGLSKSND